MPLAVAASRSMLSTPTPARAIALRLPGFSSTLAVTFAPERTIIASYAPTIGGQFFLLEPDFDVELVPGLLEEFEPFFGQFVSDENAHGRSFHLRESRASNGTSGKSGIVRAIRRGGKIRKGRGPGRSHMVEPRSPCHSEGRLQPKKLAATSTGVIGATDMGARFFGRKRPAE